jgi:hypothetical protein
MRQILSILSEYRQAQLKAAGATDTRLAEVGDMFRYLDNELSFFAHSPTATGTKMEEVMTSADFSYAIMQFVQRRMEPTYTEKSFAFEPLVVMDTTPNYLPVQRMQKPSGVDDLEYVAGEKPNPRPGYVEDAVQKQFQVYDWRKQFDFSFKLLINDDLGYFNEMASDMGRAARRTLEKFVSRMIWNATGTGFLTGLGVLYSTTGRLTTARISEARMAMMQRLNARNERILCALRYIIHPTGLLDTVATIQRSTLVPELATDATNVVAGTFTPIEDPYAVGVAPNLPWMALSDPGANGIKPFILARRAGMAGPMLLRKRSDIESFTSLTGGGGAVSPILGDFQSGNVIIQVWDTWGTYVNGTTGNLWDYRGGYYSTGTAP